MCLFIIGVEEDLTEPSELTALFEWLQEAKFSLNGKNLLSNILYSVFVITPKKENLDAINQVRI